MAVAAIEEHQLVARRATHHARLVLLAWAFHQNPHLLSHVCVEVIYTGLRQTPEAVARIALDEDADVIALSSMAASHLPFCERLKPLLERAGLGDKLWVIGGNLPAQDHEALRELGFKGIFPTGSKLDAVTDYIREHVQ